MCEQTHLHVEPLNTNFVLSVLLKCVFWFFLILLNHFWNGNVDFLSGAHEFLWALRSRFQGKKQKRRLLSCNGVSEGQTSGCDDKD